MDIATSCKSTHCNRCMKLISTAVSKYVSNGIELKHANQHFKVFVLLKFIDLFTRCMNIMLGKDYTVNNIIMLSALPSSQLN